MADLEPTGQHVAFLFEDSQFLTFAAKACDEYLRYVEVDRERKPSTLG